MNKLYRALLHLYPAEFREEYGEEMRRDFERSDAGPIMALVELPVSALREHIDVWSRDFGVSLRTLRRSPGFALAAVLAVGLGIGATTTVFSIVDAVLLRPLPYRNPEQLVVTLNDGRFPLSPRHFFALKEQQRTMAAVAAAEVWGPRWSLSDHTEFARGLRVTPEMFSMLGVAPLRGRAIAPGDERVVVLSHRLWQTRFGGADAAIGRNITLNDENYTVIGVMPVGFEFSPFWAPGDLWAPMDLSTRRNSGAQSLRIFGRLQGGATVERALDEARAITARLKEAEPVYNRTLNLQVVSLAEKVSGPVKPLVWTMFAAVVLVLLVACANVANLLLARAIERRREMAIRTALGANTRQLIRQLLIESWAIAGAGGLLGVSGAVLLIEVLRATPGDIPNLDALLFDGRLAAFAFALCVATGTLFGLAPAMFAAREDTRDGLAGSRTSTDRAGRWRGLLVASEVALSLVLLVGAGLLVRSFLSLAKSEPGFEPRRVVAVSVAMTPSHARGQVVPRLVETLRQIPGVERAGAVNHVPLLGDTWGTGFDVEGQVRDPRPNGFFRVAEPGYFDAIGMRLREGRDFNERDTMAAPRVAIINEALARTYFEPGRAIGSRLRVGSETEWRSVVGVIADAKQRDWAAPASAEVYLPFRQERDYLESGSPVYSQFTFVARVKDPVGMAERLRQELARVDRSYAVSKPELLEEAIARQQWRPRMAMATMSAFGLVTVLLASLGIYGVIAYTTSLRTKEFSIRLALGATPVSLSAGVVTGGLKLVGAGIVTGLTVAWLSTRLLEKLLYGVEARDAISFMAAPIVFIVVGILATLLPARRAAVLDPAIVLREE